MSRKEEKREGALRIFATLSGVDEELMERCEKACQAEVSSNIIPFMKYAKVMAACVCALLLGGVLLAMPRMTQKSANEADCAKPEHAYDGIWNEQAQDAGKREPVKDVCTETVAEEDFLEETAEFNGAADDEVFAGKEESDGLMIDSEISCVKDFRTELDEKRARGIDVLGEYLPTDLPDGYRFESASAAEDEFSKKFTDVVILWSRGLDVIRWRVKRVDASEISCIDVDEPEKYDVHLYEIPYADTVPDEYREVFYAPVFWAEDISLAVIEKRMKIIRDAGDTDTPRGKFGVLFEDAGILVEFSGRATAQEVFNMLLSLPTAGSTTGQD